MPELRIKEVRMPELHLPEMSRDEISRVVGDATRDIDLSKLDPRRIDVSEIDLPKAVTDAAQAVGLAKRPRPRAPFILGGLMLLGLVTVAVMTSPAVRPRLEELARRIRGRIDEARGDSSLTADEMTDTSYIGVPIEPSVYTSDIGTPGSSPFDDAIGTPNGTLTDDDAVAAGTIADMGSSTSSDDSFRG
jgi:hypothetical protein